MPELREFRKAGGTVLVGEMHNLRQRPERSCNPTSNSGWYEPVPERRYNRDSADDQNAWTEWMPLACNTTCIFSSADL